MVKVLIKIANIIGLALIAAGLVLIGYTALQWFQNPELTSMQFFQAYGWLEIASILIVGLGAWLTDVKES